MKADGALMVLNMITNISVIEQQCFLFRAVFTETLHFEHCNVCHCSLKLQHHKHLNHLFDWANNCPNHTTQLATFFFFLVHISIKSFSCWLGYQVSYSYSGDQMNGYHEKLMWSNQKYVRKIQYDLSDCKSTDLSVKMYRI